jgi:hypothetical protein
MKKIQLTNGFSAIVDDDDYEILSKHKWYSFECSHGVYARRNSSGKGGAKRGTLLMHREILKLSGTNVVLDHKDRNGLNNQKSNLRIGTYSQNMANRSSWGRSKYKGVSFHIRLKKWVATININKKQKHIGSFETEIEAAQKYNEYAKIHHGEFANLNKI